MINFSVFAGGARRSSAGSVTASYTKFSTRYHTHRHWITPWSDHKIHLSLTKSCWIIPKNRISLENGFQSINALPIKTPYFSNHTLWLTCFSINRRCLQEVHGEILRGVRRLHPRDAPRLPGMRGHPAMIPYRGTSLIRNTPDRGTSLTRNTHPLGPYHVCPGCEATQLWSNPGEYLLWIRFLSRALEPLA